MALKVLVDEDVLTWSFVIWISCLSFQKIIEIVLILILRSVWASTLGNMKFDLFIRLYTWIWLVYNTLYLNRANICLIDYLKIKIYYIIIWKWGIKRWLRWRISSSSLFYTVCCCSENCTGKSLGISQKWDFCYFLSLFCTHLCEKGVGASGKKVFLYFSISLVLKKSKDRLLSLFPWQIQMSLFFFLFFSSFDIFHVQCGPKCNEFI